VNTLARWAISPLLRVGLLTLGESDQFVLETVSLTEAGQARYDDLGRYKQRQEEPALTE